MEAVFEHVQAATLGSLAVQTRAMVLVAASRQLRQGGLVVQCAWCGRIGDGEDRWARLEWLVLRPDQTTGSICRGCLATNSPQPH